MLTFVVSGPLREFAGNRSTLQIDGSARNVSEAFSLLWNHYPAFRDRVITEIGDVRPHVNVFVDGESIRYSGGLSTPVREGAEIVILPALSGG